MAEDPLAAIKRKYIEQLYAINNHHIEEVQRRERAITAMGWGLPVEQFATPFPGSVNITTINHALTMTPAKPESPPAKFWSWGSLIAFVAFVTAAVLGLSSLGAFLLWKATAPANQPAQAKPIEFDVEWQDKDGQWHKMVKPK